LSGTFDSAQPPRDLLYRCGGTDRLRARRPSRMGRDYRQARWGAAGSAPGKAAGIISPPD